MPWRITVLLAWLALWVLSYLCTMSDPSPYGLILAAQRLAAPSLDRNTLVFYFLCWSGAPFLISAINFITAYSPFALLFLSVRLSLSPEFAPERLSRQILLILPMLIACGLVAFCQIPSNDDGGMRDVIEWRGIDLFPLFRLH
jgi:predicted membrane-bound mannosyltransferase